MRLTKRFMDWYQGNNDKEKETPKGGVKRVGYVLWNVRPWRGGIAEKYISHYGIGMEAEYGDRNHCGNCRRNFAGTGTIFSVSAAYDRRFFSADGDICLCGQGRGAKGAAAL